MRFNRLAALALCCVATVEAAQAAPTMFSGSGTVARRYGSLAPTGVAAVDSALSFSFVFDPATATSVFAGPQSSAYEVAVRDFSATLGGYSFALADQATTPAVISLGRGFGFFGGNGTEPALFWTFYLPGVARATVSSDAPFRIGAGGGDTLELSARFRDNGSGTPTLDNLFDPAGGITTFAYVARDRSGFGVLDGRYAGAFAAAGGVPEPATWALLILGFGAVGGVLRRRRRFAVA